MTQNLHLFDWPITFLQDNLHGIYRGDLIMLAASTGVGKSTISRIVSREAMKENVPVVLYSLEDEFGTFMKKSVYRLYCKNNPHPMDYRNFKNEFENTDKFKEERIITASDLIRKSPDGLPLMTVHEMKSPNWTVAEVIRQMRTEILSGHTFFILDHFDILVNDNAADQLTAMNDLWRFVSQNKIALLTFSQLSAKRNKESLCPGIDDLRGSRVKVNTPTIVLSLARHGYNFYGDATGAPTYCRILKDRDNGQTKCAVIFYENEGYRDEYRDVSCNESGTKIDGETRTTLEKNK